MKNAAPAAPPSTNAALEALRQADDENRARAGEVHQLRTQLADTERQLAAAREERDRADARAEANADAAERQTQALKVVIREVAATKEALTAARDENTRLKAAVESATRQSKEMRTMLGAKTTTHLNEGSVAHSGAVQYMQHCYALSVDPSAVILRCLFERTPVLSTTGSEFSHVAVLLDVLRASPGTAEGIVALELEWSEEQASIGSELVRLLPDLVRLTAVGVDEAGVEALSTTARLAGGLQELELPALAVNDAGVRAVSLALNEREQLAAADATGATKPLLLKELDVSKCRIDDASMALANVRGQHIGWLNLAHCASLDRVALHRVLDGCPAVTTLNVAGCTRLSNDICAILNAHPMLRDVDLTGATGITHVALDHVVILRTTLQATVVLQCPQLVELPTPATSFQVATWSCPLLETCAWHGVTLSAREFQMLSSCASLRNVAFVNCRVNGLDTMLRRLRRLEVVSFNGTKGVTDVDIKCLCSTLTSLDLTDGFCLTDKAIAHLHGCPRLRELTLKRCSNLTDAGLLSLDGHEGLEYLNVLATKRITTAPLSRLTGGGGGGGGGGCRSLQHIVHETFLSTTVRVDRDDAEEAERRRLREVEQELQTRRSALNLVGVDQQGPGSSFIGSTSRPHSPRSLASTMSGSPRKAAHSSSSPCGARLDL